MEEVKNYWNNLSYKDRIELFKHSDFDEMYEDKIQGIYNAEQLDCISGFVWDELLDYYQDFIKEVYQNDDILHYYTRADNWKELSNKEKEDRLSGKEIETPRFIDLNKVPLDVLIENLDRKYMYLSSWEASVINKLITFYKENK